MIIITIVRNNATIIKYDHNTYNTHTSKKVLDYFKDLQQRTWVSEYLKRLAWMYWSIQVI